MSGMSTPMPADEDYRRLKLAICHLLSVDPEHVLAGSMDIEDDGSDEVMVRWQGAASLPRAQWLGLLAAAGDTPPAGAGS